MVWKKQFPDKVGYWLRVNAGHRVSLEKVFELDGKLAIHWGWSNQPVRCLIDDIKEKLECFWWYGPMPEPPEEAL